MRHQATPAVTAVNSSITAHAVSARENREHVFDGKRRTEEKARDREREKKRRRKRRTAEKRRCRSRVSPQRDYSRDSASSRKRGGACVSEAPEGRAVHDSVNHALCHGTTRAGYAKSRSILSISSKKLRRNSGGTRTMVPSLPPTNGVCNCNSLLVTGGGQRTGGLTVDDMHNCLCTLYAH